MKLTTYYESVSYHYENSSELSKHVEEMERSGWKVTSQSYGYLKARFRRDLKGERK